MRIIKRIAAVLLACTALVLSFASCTQQRDKEAAPDGMANASAAGAYYSLYVPTTWTLNNYYGVSGAFHYVLEKSCVSARTYSSTLLQVEDGQGDRNLLFWEQFCLPEIRKSALNNEVTLADDENNNAAIILYDTPKDDQPAKNTPAVYRHVTAYVTALEKQKMHFVYIVAEREGNFYVIAYTGTEDAYELAKEDLDKIRENFRFRYDPYQPESAAWTPADVTPPEGMQVASSDEVAYRFFVPANWKVETQQRIFAAYDPDDRTNVNVTCFQPAQIPDDSLIPDDKKYELLDEYFGKMAELIEQAGGTPDREIKKEQITLGGKTAMQYEFSYTVGGKTYRYLQVITLHGQMVYTLTYTAGEEFFTKHLTQFKEIKEAFAFR